MFTDMPFKHYKDKPGPYLGHDGRFYVDLGQGDIIAPGDYLWDGARGWSLATDGFGAPVTNSLPPLHRYYRRRASWLPMAPYARGQGNGGRTDEGGQKQDAARAR